MLEQGLQPAGGALLVDQLDHAVCPVSYTHLIPVPESVAKQEDIDESKLPKFWTIVGIILIPLVLIIANSVAKVVPALSGIQPVLAFLGEPFVALTIAVIAAMFLLGYKHGYSSDCLLYTSRCV